MLSDATKRYFNIFRKSHISAQGVWHVASTTEFIHEAEV